VDVMTALIWVVAIAWGLMFFLGLGGIELLQAVRAWAGRLWERARRWRREG
jgi:hypothetical protein